MTPEQVAHPSEVDDAIARWWYEFGRQNGIAEGRAQVEAELEQAWRERQRLQSRWSP